ncbi:hypothetical protein ABGN05_24430 [Aquibium sp. LZ166]|uniref:Uncharacterized protein n=1 Tax=Aquibium pacificus TaxID=3153579 RepID=A0ABV3SPS2_9HYPH
MPRIIEIKRSHTPLQLHRLAASTKDANQGPAIAVDRGGAGRDESGGCG